MAEPLIIQDILGNRVSLSPEFLHSLEPSLLGKIKTLLKRPALVVAEKDPTRLHYFRSSEWYETLLLTVTARNHQYEAESYHLNPSGKKLSQILKKGDQII